MERCRENDDTCVDERDKLSSIGKLGEKQRLPLPCFAPPESLSQLKRGRRTSYSVCKKLLTTQTHSCNLSYKVANPFFTLWQYNLEWSKNAVFVTNPSEYSNQQLTPKVCSTADREETASRGGKGRLCPEEVPCWPRAEKPPSFRPLSAPAAPTCPPGKLITAARIPGAPEIPARSPASWGLSFIKVYH